LTKGRDHLEDAGVQWRIILKMNKNKQTGRDLLASGTTEGSCEHGNVNDMH
jgi:hypothetical protein